jgi:hypothetical protein
VLVYRGITFWLAIAIGWPVYCWLLRHERQPERKSPGGRQSGRLS